MKPNRFLPLFALAFSPWAALACSSQADTSYQGDPLMTLHGTVTLSGAAPATPIEAALVWDHMHIDTDDGGYDLNTPKTVATKAPVTGSFPAGFTMQVLTPPPDDVLFPCNPDDPSSVRIGRAEIAAIDQAADPSNLVSTDFYGEAVGFTVIYAESDLASGACFMLASIGWDPPLTKGYHLLAPLPETPPATLASDERAYKACEADGGSSDACAALLPDAGSPLVSFSTPITITVPMPPSTQSFTTGIALPPPTDAGTQPTQCLPQPLPTSATTAASACQIVIGLTSGTCDGALLGADVTEQAIGQAFQESYALSGVYIPTVCQLPQIPSSEWSGGTCVQAPRPGWCYVTGAAAGTCSQSIILSAVTSTTPSLQGAPAALNCP